MPALHVHEGGSSTRAARQSFEMLLHVSTLFVALRNIIDDSGIY